jgi:predicted adenylyl cyclase CyaB
MQNIEIKVRIFDKPTLAKRINTSGAEYQYTMTQCDYYFGIGDKKEKLRIINGEEFQLITYERSEKQGRKDSYYKIKELSVDEKESLLREMKPVKTVKKTRELWIIGHTRIHIDHVERLGDFLELETVLTDISPTEGEKEFWEVIEKLNIDAESSVPASYADLMPVAV